MELVDLFPFLTDYGYIGLTLVSFFGSLVPFVPLPGILILATMSVGDSFNLHLLAVISAVFSTAAKQIIFLVSYGGRRILTDGTRNRIRPFERLVKKYGATAAFVAAATPIPDDIVYVPLGLARYNPLRFFVATLAGKFVLSYIVIAISHNLGISLIEPLLSEVQDASGVYIGFAVFAALLTGMVILTLRLNWARLLGRMAPWTLEEDDDSKKDATS